MQGPLFLPLDLIHYEACESDKELFVSLTRKPSDLVTFFEYACADDEWRETHLKIIRSLFRWGAKAYYLNQLPVALAQKMAQVVQTHHRFLQPLLYFKAALFFTVALTIEGQKVLVNSLMFGAFSPFFTQFFKLNCFDRWRNEGELPHVTLSRFHLVEKHLLRGEIDDLWKQSAEDVQALMTLAKKWEIPSLVKECAQILRRYISKENVLETLLQAHQQFFVEWKHDCYAFFNEQGGGIRFVRGQDSDLRVEVLDYRQETLELFSSIAPWITHLIVGGHLSENPLFSRLVKSCVKLVGVDLSGSFQDVGQLEAIPTKIMALNLSACPWLSNTSLSQIRQRFFGLQELILNSNLHLNYLAWGELHHFARLESLHVARCHQMTDEGLRLISRACPHLIELNVEECRGLGDGGVAEVIHHCRRLQILNISRCYQLTDRSLIEMAQHAHRLTHLILVYNPSFSDKGLWELVQLRASLKYLDVTGCGFSSSLLERIGRDYPAMQLIAS